MNDCAPTERFSSRVADYIRYRPSYPAEVIDWLNEKGAFTAESVIADIGSGTGLSSALFLRDGHRVYGVEPNREMREAGARLLAAYPQFASVAGQAEATALADESIDLIVAGQAFHWFQRDSAHREFCRILREPGWVVLLWNDRRVEATPFLREYDALLREYGTDYREVDHKNLSAETFGMFFNRGYETASFDNAQTFDYSGLEGRVRSSSYMPEPGDPRFSAMAKALRALFDRYTEHGTVVLEYDTRLFCGRLK